MAVVGLFSLVVMTGLALSAPLIEDALGMDAESVDLLNRYAEPSTEHWLGADELGRDAFLRLLYGGQVSLGVALLGALSASFIGALVGLAAGYLGGRVDQALMRFADGVIALPLLPLLIVLAALDPGKIGIPTEWATHPAFGAVRTALIIALVGWPVSARLTRAAVLGLKQREFVLAARSLGAGPIRIVFLHLLPNAAAPIIVATTLATGNVILMESALSFLGLGVQPPLPSWGNMLTGALDLIWSAPWLAIWPGAAIFLTVISFNFVGDGLQDALDPKSDLRS